MKFYSTQAIERTGDAAPQARFSPVVERCGYLADETVFNFIRAGIEQALARHGITTPVYVCHSLGCFVGLDAASRQERACVIAINMPASPWSGFRRAFVAGLRMIRIAGARGIAEAADFRNSLVYFGRPHIDDLARLRLKRIRQGTNCYTVPRRQDMALFLKAALLEHRPRGPHVPRVLVLQGDSDPIAPARDEASLRKRLPRSLLVTLRGAHVLPVTHPRDVVRAVEEFFAKV